MRIKYIDSDEEHIQVLFELKILDDIEDWKLFQLQEEIENPDIDFEIYRKYALVKGKRLV